VVIDIADEGGATTEATTTVLAYGYSASGTFAIGDKALTGLAPGFTKTVAFWSSTWNKANPLTGGTAPSSFKGFINQPPATPVPPATIPLGTTWSTLTGSSSAPPASVPAYMLVLVTRNVAQVSSTVQSGSVAHWVVVKTSAGYGPTAGQTGLGTVVAVLP
jgi:hypothetical protein